MGNSTPTGVLGGHIVGYTDTVMVRCRMN